VQCHVEKFGLVFYLIDEIEYMHVVRLAIWLGENCMWHAWNPATLHARGSAGKKTEKESK
jgi:hypothetical protein